MLSFASVISIVASDTAHFVDYLCNISSAYINPTTQI